MEVRVSEIVVGKRSRQGYGLLDSLERSIGQLGVLQPIGITPDKELIFGGRRLQACKNIGKETIPVRVFDIEADDAATALKMERDENDQRIDLSPSEKVALGERIEEALAGRVGNPNLKPIRQNFAELEPQQEKPQIPIVPPETVPKGRSSEIAAAAVGMDRETYRQAKHVVKSGNEEVIQKMDSGETPVYKAYEAVSNITKPKTFKITLYNNPNDDAVVLLSKGGKKYCTALAVAMLKLAGHHVEI